MERNEKKELNVWSWISLGLGFVLALILGYTETIAQAIGGTLGGFMVLMLPPYIAAMISKRFKGNFIKTFKWAWIIMVGLLIISIVSQIIISR